MAENKHLGLVLVAIVALVAVVGLVMLFTTGQFKQFGKIEAVTTPEGGESGALVGEAGKGKISNNCVLIETNPFSKNYKYNYLIGKNGNYACRSLGLSCAAMIAQDTYRYFDSVDGSCSGKIQMSETDTFISRTAFLYNGDDVCSLPISTSETNDGIFFVEQCLTNDDSSFVEPILGDTENRRSFSGALCCK